MSSCSVGSYDVAGLRPHRLYDAGSLTRSLLTRLNRAASEFWNASTCDMITTLGHLDLRRAGEPYDFLKPSYLLQFH